MEGLSEESSWRALLCHRIECIDRSNIFKRQHPRPSTSVDGDPILDRRHALCTRASERYTPYLEHNQSRVSQRRGPTQAGTGFFKRGILMSNEREEVDLGDAALPLSIDFRKAGGVSRES
jgi:hypothetical protein